MVKNANFLMIRIILLCLFITQISDAEASRPQGVSYDWMETEINSDLGDYPARKISISTLEKAYNAIPHPFKALVTIKGRSISFKTEDSPVVWHKGRIKNVQIALSKALRRKPPIDTSFIIDLGDLLFYTDDYLDIPIFGFCKVADGGRGILIPDSPNIDCLKWKVSKDRIVPWEKKNPKAYFRGATTGGFYNKENYLSIPRV